MHNIDLDADFLKHWHGPTSTGLDPGKTALIVIDLQVAFMEKGLPSYGPHCLDIVPYVNRLTKAFRERGAKIFFLRHTVLDDGPSAPPLWRVEDENVRIAMDHLRSGCASHDLHPGLDVRIGDYILNKYRYSAFLPISSTLDTDLRAAGISNVVITGTMTNVCCESSARDAHMLGYNVIFVADATCTSDDHAHNSTLNNMARYFALVKTSDQMIAVITRFCQSTEARHLSSNN